MGQKGRAVEFMLSLLALIAMVNEQPGCVFKKNATKSQVACVRAVEVWRSLWHIPVMTMLYFGRSIPRCTRYSTMLCSSSAGSAQDWCSWKSGVEDQYWNSMKTHHSVPISITTWANLDKIYINDHFQHSKLMAFSISVTELGNTAILVAGSSIMKSHCAKNLLKMLLPVSEPHSSCWGGAKQGNCPFFFREVE